MHPHTARRLIAAAPPGGMIADPFMGGGTVMVEALLQGRAAYGADVNPVAIEVAWARTRVVDRARREQLVAEARAVIQRARAIRQHGGVPKPVQDAEGPWYDPPALHEVWSIARALRETSDVNRMLSVCLSSIIVKASRQASDSVTKVDRDHRWIPRGRVEQWFVRRVEEHARNLGALAARVSSHGPGDGHGDAPAPVLWQRDARDDPRALLSSRVAAVVTSPPYPGVFDYVEHHRRRYAALGLDAQLAERAEIGARRASRHQSAAEAGTRFMKQMRDTLAAWRPTLMPGARIYLVLGDGQHRERIVPVLPLLDQAAVEAEMTISASVSQARRVHGQGVASTHKEEHVVALEVVQ